MNTNLKNIITENDNETVCTFRVLGAISILTVLGISVGAAATGVWLVSEVGTATGAILAGTAAGVWGKGKR